MFDDKTIEALGSYVYALEDGHNNIFYIGKGKGNRVFAHVAGQLASLHKEKDEDNAELSEKNKIIQDLIQRGEKINSYVLTHGRDENTALAIEATLIDLLSLPGKTFNLTNLVRGHHAEINGIASTDDIITQYNAKALDIENLQHKIMLININRQNESCKTDSIHIDENKLYEAVRWCWRMNVDEAKNADYVLATYRGIVKGVYKPLRWAKVQTGQERSPGDADRVYFEGEPAPSQIKDIYYNKKVSEVSTQNPIRYLWKDNK
jgi:hypothetical protein